MQSDKRVQRKVSIGKIGKKQGGVEEKVEVERLEWRWRWSGGGVKLEVASRLEWRRIPGRIAATAQAKVEVDVEARVELRRGSRGRGGGNSDSLGFLGHCCEFGFLSAHVTGFVTGFRSWRGATAVRNKIVHSYSELGRFTVAAAKSRAKSRVAADRVREYSGGGGCEQGGS
ncbi:unnamed protein product [Calypogeia fissa]